jgi:hypothetical protein
LQIGWIEEIEPVKNLRGRTLSQEGAEKCLSRAREGNGIEQNGTEENLGASAPADSLFSADSSSSVRPDVPASPTFEDFWAVWWNHTAKAKAKRLWSAAAARFGAQFLIDAAIADQRRFEPTTAWEWRSQMHPTTWLNGKRWEDELPPNGKSSVASIPSKQSRSAAIAEALKGFDDDLESGSKKAG